jgi:hypothetical protein
MGWDIDVVVITHVPADPSVVKAFESGRGPGPGPLSTCHFALSTPANGKWNVTILEKLGKRLRKEQQRSDWFTKRGDKVPSLPSDVLLHILKKKWERIRRKWTDVKSRPVPGEDRWEGHEDIQGRLDTEGVKGSKRSRRSSRVQTVRGHASDIIPELNLIQKLKTRKDICQEQIDNAVDAPTKDSWEFLLHTFTLYGSYGVSSDESDSETERNQTLRVRKLPWRRPMDHQLVTIENIRLSQVKRGAKPMRRRRDAPGTGLLSTRAVPTKLPQDLYDPAWLQAQNHAFRKRLAIDTTNPYVWKEIMFTPCT